MEIKINVDNQKLKVATNLKTYISGTKNFVKITFNFMDKIWGSLKTYAQFRQGDEAYNLFLDENNSVYLPPELVAGECLLILHGVLAEQIPEETDEISGDIFKNATVVGITDALRLEIKENMILADAESSGTTPSLYAQLMKIIGTGNLITEGLNPEPNPNLTDVINALVYEVGILKSQEIFILDENGNEI